MKKKYCTICRVWIDDRYMATDEVCIECNERRLAVEAESERRQARLAERGCFIAARQDTDYSSDEVLERRIEAHRRMRRERQQLAERLYLKFVDDVLLNQLVADRDRSLNWKEMACLAVVGADALLAALDEQQDQLQIPPYEG